MTKRSNQIRWGPILLVVAVVAILAVAFGPVRFFLSQLGEPATDRMPAVLSPDGRWSARTSVDDFGAAAGTYSQLVICEPSDTSWSHGEKVWESWRLIPEMVMWTTPESLVVVVGPLSHADSLTPRICSTWLKHGVYAATRVRVKGGIAPLELAHSR